MNKQNVNLLKVFISIIKLSPWRFFQEYLFTILDAIFLGLITIQLEKVFMNVIDFYNHKVDWTDVLSSLLILLAYNIFGQVSGGIASYYGEFYSDYSIQHLLKELNHKIAKLSPISFEDPKMMNLIESATAGARSVRSVLNVVMDILCMYIPYFIFMGVYLYSLKPILCISLLFVFFPVLLAQIIKKKYYGQLEEFQAPLRRKKTAYSRYITDRAYLKETRSLRATSYFYRLFNKTAVNYYNLNYLFQRKANKVDAIAQLLTLLGYGGVILISIIGVINGDIIAASFSAIYASLSNLFSLMEELFHWRMGEVAGVYGKVEKYITFLNFEEKEDATTLIEHDMSSIVLEDVSFSYPTKKHVLQNINLTIKKGESVAIVGENGSGKTTLSRLILGLYSPKDGDILYDGISANRIHSSQIYNNSSAVFQNFNRYKMNLSNNIRISDVNKIDSSNNLMKCLNWVGLDEKNSKFFSGLDTVLSSEFGGIDLSGGEWQRIAIARGIYKNHNIIVLDEPTASIDPIQENEIFMKFNELSNSAIKIVVTHRLAAVKYCTKIVVLEKGRIVAVGSHQALLENSTEYSRLWNSQAKLYE